MSDAPTNAYTTADLLPLAPMKRPPRLKPFDGPADYESGIL